MSPDLKVADNLRREPGKVGPELELQVKTAAEEFRRKFAERVERVRTIEAGRRAAILEPLGLGELADKDDDEVMAELARRLAAIPEHVRSEFAP